MSQIDPPGSPAAEPRPRRPVTLGAGAVVVHEGRVLIVRNIRGVTRGRYLLPDGRVNAGEQPDHAAAPETFEETQMRVDDKVLPGDGLWGQGEGAHNTCLYHG